MNPRTVLIAGGSAAVVVFLLGFIPQYLKSRGLESQLAAAHESLAVEHAKSQLDDLSLLVGYVYLEAELKNYGVASQYSTRFFNRVRAMADQHQNPDRQAFLQASLAKRDSITAGLAKGDPGIVAAIQDLFQSTLAATEAGPN